jgi:hypothetical protein
MPVNGGFQMTDSAGPLVIHDPTNAAARNSECTRDLAQRDFPRSLVCVEGRVMRFLDLRSPANSLSEESSLRYICIPSSIETISRAFFRPGFRLKNVVFESGCGISTFGQSTFACCLSLQSICVPSSIRAISNQCFDECRHLSSLTFERVLSHIESGGICVLLVPACVGLHSFLN